MWAASGCAIRGCAQLSQSTAATNDSPAGWQPMQFTVRALSAADAGRLGSFSALFNVAFEDPMAYGSVLPSEAYLAERPAKEHSIAVVASIGAAIVVVRAPSHEAAAKLFERHPHITVFPCDAVDVILLLGPDPGA